MLLKAVVDGTEVDLGTFEVSSALNNFNITLPFASGSYNLTATAFNEFGVSSSFTKEFISMAALSQPLTIAAESEASVRPDEEKWFYLDFHEDEIAPSTCFVVDFGDGIRKAFGDQEYCQEWTLSRGEEYINAFLPVRN